MTRARILQHFFSENREGADLSGEALRSGAVALLSRGVVAVVQIISSIVLARLLLPEDYGLVAIVAALTSFVPMLIDLGLTDSTVQNRTITPAQISALFWFSIGVSGLVALTLFFGSSSIAAAYGHPEIAGIASAWALTFVLYGASLQHMALLRRAMRYKDIAYIEIAASIGGSGVTVALGFIGFGYWALVMRPIVAAAITAIGCWIRCPWVPGAPTIDSEVRRMLKFGMNVTGGAVAWIATSSADRAVIGFRYPAATIGLYQNALMLYDNAQLGISMPLHKVGVSALSKLRDDYASFRKRYAEALQTVTFFSMLAFGGLAVVAQDFVEVMLGKKWIAAGPILSVFALRGIVQVMENSQTWLHMPLGRPDRWIRWALATAVVQVVAVFAGLPFGVLGVATSIVVARSLLAFPAVLYAGRPIGLKAGVVVRAIWRQLLGTAAMIVVGKLLLHWLPAPLGHLPRLILGIVVCTSVYLAIVVGVLGLRDPLRIGVSIAGRTIPRRYHPWLPFVTTASDVPLEAVALSDGVAGSGK